MDKAIAEKIARDYIIESMAKGLNLTQHEGPHFPTGIWGFNPADQYLFTYSSGIPTYYCISKFRQSDQGWILRRMKKIKSG
jgi:hypothetical protein